MASCGTCSECCDLLGVEEIGKPALSPCRHIAGNGKGCSIYAQRPASCVGFMCLWLASQSRERRDERMPLALRPDISKVVMGPRGELDPTTLFVHVRPTQRGAWLQEPVHSHLRQIARRGGTVVVVIGDERIILKSGQPDIHTTEAEIEHRKVIPFRRRIAARDLPMTLPDAPHG